MPPHQSCLDAWLETEEGPLRTMDFSQSHVMLLLLKTKTSEKQLVGVVDHPSRCINRPTDLIWVQLLAEICQCFHRQATKLVLHGMNVRSMILQVLKTKIIPSRIRRSRINLLIPGVVMEQIRKLRIIRHNRVVVVPHRGSRLVQKKILRIRRNKNQRVAVLVVRRHLGHQVEDALLLLVTHLRYWIQWRHCSRQRPKPVEKWKIFSQHLQMEHQSICLKYRRIPSRKKTTIKVSMNQVLQRMKSNGAHQKILATNLRCNRLLGRSTKVHLVVLLGTRV
mmetsp:Transcript_29784/g.72135  ORF Transcript_29784/g.72135 Transcript_29784/m.72135 type:complete len:279 (+) Transcript_29784:1261-2097(+)